MIKPNLQLPLAYQHLLPKSVLQGVPEEKLATCSKCAMCKPEDSNTKNSPEYAVAYFRADTKCCTYHPNLPNYAVGGILSDNSSAASEGRERIKGKIRGRIGVLPLGIWQPRKYRLLYGSGFNTFGHAESLRCPYYLESGLCSIWKYRESICSTWFCKFEKGFHGQQYWEAMRDYLLRVQVLLVHFVLKELGMSAEQIIAQSDGPTIRKGSDSKTVTLTADDLDDRPPTDAAYARLWGEWVGREEEIYVKAYEIVRALTHDDVVRLGGLDLQLLEERLVHHTRKLANHEIPKVLIRNPDLRAQRQTSGSFLVTTYSIYDATLVNAEVFALLEYFDGVKSTDIAIEEFCEETGTLVSSEILQQLYERRILMEPVSTT